MTNPTSRYLVRFPPHCTPPVLDATRSIKDAPGTMKTPQSMAKSFDEAREHREEFSVATEDTWTSRSTSTTTAKTTSPLRPGFPFEESHESRVTGTTPPALRRHQCVPLPTQCGSEVVLHRLLLAPRKAGLHWDLLWSHEGVEAAMESGWSALRDPATFPAIPSMTVVHHWLPWPITVHESGLDSRGVTVVDVLVAISREMLQPVGEERSRIKMDFLRGRRVFLGLRTSRVGGDIWELVVG
ncbi:MAP kinase kinase kinase kinase activity protein [Marasmius tenuissimus]|nr:MAP kinase kinase kinase kinase activity protein [Marasmius tenuissimus]